MSQEQTDREFILAVGAIFATVLMATGDWDVFDVLVSGGFLFYVLIVHWHSRKSWFRDLFFSGALAIVSLAFVLGLLTLRSIYTEDINPILNDHKSVQQFKKYYDPDLYCGSVDDLDKKCEEKRKRYAKLYPSDYFDGEPAEYFRIQMMHRGTIYFGAFNFWFIILIFKSAGYDPYKAKRT